jgi:hypothetical protein
MRSENRFGLTELVELVAQVLLLDCVDTRVREAGL